MEEPEVLDNFKKTVFWSEQDSCIYELIEIVIALNGLGRLRPSNTQAWRKWRDRHKEPPTTDN